MPQTTTATAHNPTAAIRILRRSMRSARMPVGKVATAPTNDTTAIRGPISVLPMCSACFSWSDTAATVPCSAESSPSVAPKTAMTCNRAGPPAASTARVFALPAMSAALAMPR